VQAFNYCIRDLEAIEKISSIAGPKFAEYGAAVLVEQEKAAAAKTAKDVVKASTYHHLITSRKD